jgi:hypothetical protein
MPQYLVFILTAFWIIVSFCYAYFEGTKKTIGFWGCIFIMLIFTPFFGYFIIESFAQKNAKGCGWCGNKYNEAEYCGICGKNKEGVVRKGFVER